MHDYIVHRHAPLLARPKETDIYVTRGKPLQVYVSRAKKLLSAENVRSVRVCGTGAALYSAAQVAMLVHHSLGDMVILAPRTSSVIVMDEYQHKENIQENKCLERIISQIDITIRKTT